MIALLGLCLLWPAFRHLETAGGKHFGDAVALQGMGGQGVADDPRAKPSGVMDGLRRGLDHDRIG